MTETRPRAVDLGSLKLDARIGQGGQGSVHQVLNRRINETGDSWSVVYKEYNATMLPRLDTRALNSMVALLDVVDGEQGRWLCEKTAWPAAVVEDQGQARGFLMRAVPDRFWITVPGMTGESSGKQRLASIEYLLNDHGYLNRIGLSVSDKDRVLLLADLADTLVRLHRLGIAVGDLSPKNLLFTVGSRPECFLIDCDAMRLHGASVLPQVETPDWQVPGGEEKATRESDMYKFGLLAIRLFAQSQNSIEPGAVSLLGSRIQDLATASLAVHPQSRPTPVAWTDALGEAAATASTTPASAPPPAPVPMPPQPTPREVPKVTIPAVAAATAKVLPRSTARPNSSTTRTVRGSDRLEGLRGIALVVATLCLINAYTDLWIDVPNPGGRLYFDYANTLSLMLFAKAYAVAAVGLLCALVSNYTGQICGVLLSFISIGCLLAGYERLGNYYGINNIQPSSGYTCVFVASALVVVFGIGKCVAMYSSKHP